MNHEDFVRELSGALEDNDFEHAEELFVMWGPSLARADRPVDGKTATELLKKLREKKQHGLTLKVAECFLQTDLYHVFEVHRQYAQALIEQGSYLAALNVLGPLELSARQAGDSEALEAAGLLGRTYKQMYVGGHRKENLELSINWYRFVYDHDRSKYWQGINLAALAWRAEHDGVILANPVDFRDICREVLAQLEAAGEPKPGEGYWQDATKAEALLGLNRLEEAREALVSATRRPDADAFSMSSTLRQFDEIWMLDERGGELTTFIDILRSSLMVTARDGRFVQRQEVVARSVRSIAARTQEMDRVMEFEKVFKDADPMPFRWILSAQRRALRIGRVWLGDTRGCGTGFLLDDGASLHPKWSGRQVFVTCNHVVGMKRKDTGFPPQQVTVTFDALERNPDRPTRYRVQQVLWESLPEEFDTTCLLLEGKEDRIQPEDAFPVVLDESGLPSGETDRVYIIGHPHGGELCFSFQDNHFVDRNETRLQYLAPTHPGNSGSPVFNEALHLIGMHHAGGDLRQLKDPGKIRKTNQGIPLPAIVRALAADEHRLPDLSGR
jgi:hypothetical protein